MIIRDEPGGMLLIPQTEHSQFVGQLAAHWGNQRFDVPEPFESVARAAAFHDYGYLDWEPDVPLMRPPGALMSSAGCPGETGGSTRTGTASTGCRASTPTRACWSACTAPAFWRNRYGAIDHPAMSGARRLGADVEAFIEHAEAEQKECGKAFDAHALRINFHLLQVWDLLGLFFGCQEPGEERIEPVPTGYANEAPVSLSMKNLGGGSVAFDPFPFDRRGLKVQMRAKRLARPRYDDEKSFRAAWYRAPNVLLEYELV